ncbi:unnamed protein product, partial [marine sediment metagenome]
ELNQTNSNKTYTYPSVINATTNISSINSESIYNLSLYRDSSVIATTATATSLTEEIKLGFGSYNYTAIFFSTNYTNITTNMTNRFAIVNKGDVSLNLTLDGLNSNNSYSYSDTINITAWKNSTDPETPVNITVFMDGAIINTSTSLDILENLTILTIGTYNFSATVTSTNYTDISITENRFAIVTDADSPSWRNQLQNSSTVLTGESLNLSAEGYDYVGLDFAWLSTNESGEWVNYTTEEDDTDDETACIGNFQSFEEACASATDENWTTYAANDWGDRAYVLENFTINSPT